MKASDFRKLEMELPVQRSCDQRPFFAIGLLLVLLFFVAVAIAYLQSQTSIN